MLGSTNRRPLPGKVRICDQLTNEKGKLIVWWYGGIAKNHKAQSVPKAAVFFRRLDDQGVPGDFVRKDIALTYLGLLRIGTIWENGVCKNEAILQAESTLDVDFTKGAWSFISPYECIGKSEASPIKSNDYPLYFTNDRNWLINFPLADGKNLLVPCMEFLVRCYGRSQEVVREIATYPWEEVEKRMWVPFDQPIIPGTWPVKLKKRIYNSDTVFVAHAKYDLYTRNVTKSIYSQAETAFGNGDRYAFIKVAPWFQGEAKLKIGGLWINDGKTFLALRVLGCSDPQDESIQRDRENYNKTEKPADGIEVGKAWDGAPGRLTKKPAEIIDLTDAQEPDHGSATVEIEEDDFEILGPQRIVIDTRREQAKSSAGKPGDGGNTRTYSSGEDYGSGKNVGYASIHAEAVMESEGMLRDMWNAMRYLKQDKTQLIQSVEWFTFDKGFCTDTEPRLIALQPLVDTSQISYSTAIKNWSYYDVSTKEPRGILVVRILVDGKINYIIEIQRRPQKKKNEKKELVDSEQSFTGLIFTLDSQDGFVEWLKELLADIRHTKGVMQKLVQNCPGKAYAFKHSKSSDDRIPCEGAVKNALSKIE